MPLREDAKGAIRFLASDRGFGVGECDKIIGWPLSFFAVLLETFVQGGNHPYKRRFGQKGAEAAKGKRGEPRKDVICA